MANKRCFIFLSKLNKYHKILFTHEIKSKKLIFVYKKNEEHL